MALGKSKISQVKMVHSMPEVETEELDTEFAGN